MDELDRSFIASCRIVRDLKKALYIAESHKADLKQELKEKKHLGIEELESLWFDNQ